MKTRNATQEGRFYPSGSEGILRQIREIDLSGRYPDPGIEPKKIYGGILPHAGHVYSGYQTIPFFQILKRLGRIPETFVILHPNHSGMGQDLQIDEADFWINSLGRISTDMEFAEKMDLPFADTGRIREHSAEVIIPYMQYYLTGKEWSIVPLCIKNQSHDLAGQIAERIHYTARKLKRDILLIASCDFSHFLPPAEGKNMDQLVIDEIMARRSLGVEQMVSRHQISVCGYGPIMALMHYAELQNEEYHAKILARGHSGEVHSSPEVVDYVSMILYN